MTTTTTKLTPHPGSYPEGRRSAPGRRHRATARQRDARRASARHRRDAEPRVGDALPRWRPPHQPLRLPVHRHGAAERPRRRHPRSAAKGGLRRRRTSLGPPQGATTALDAALAKTRSRGATKQATLLALLSRPEGASIDELAEATG